MNYEFKGDSYKKYFNDEFNFNNKVNSNEKKLNKVDQIRKLQNFDCSGGIMLEPRLQEYLKRKEFFRKNNIRPDIPLEKEFQITKDDIKNIRKMMKGKTDIYDQQKYPLKDKDKKRKNKLKNPGSDPRIPKGKGIKYDKPKNMGMFADEDVYYEIPSEMHKGPLHARDIINNDIDIDYNGIDNKSLDQIKKKRNKRNKNKKKISKYGSIHNMGMYPDLDIKKNSKSYARESMDLNDDIIGSMPPKFTKKNFKLKNKPKKQWNPYMEYNYYPSEMTSNIYKHKYGGFNQYDLNETSYMDFDSRKMIPRIKENNKQMNPQHNMVPFMGHGKGMSDTCLETELIRGMPSRTSKSYGFENPEEHFFQYLDEDIQQAENFVLPFPRGGESTRLKNKKKSEGGGRIINRDIF